MSSGAKRKFTTETQRTQRIFTAKAQKSQRKKENKEQKTTNKESPLLRQEGDEHACGDS